MWRIFKTAHVKVWDFRDGRTRQPDEQFIIECGLPAEPDAGRIALAVRRAVANIGLVDPQYILATDEYPDQLGKLPLWDSMDWVAFVMELEGELGTTIPDPEATLLMDPYPWSVKQVVARVYEMLRRRG
jgi:acyl carrier protein